MQGGDESKEYGLMILYGLIWTYDPLAYGVMTRENMDGGCGT